VTSLALLLVFAAAPLDEDPAFVEAQQLYRELEFERATIRFQETALSPGRSAEEQAQIFTWIGLCYAQLGDMDGARRALGDAVAKHPTVQLPPDAPPKLREMLEEVRGSQAPVADPGPEDPQPAQDTNPPVPEPETSVGGMVLTGVGGGALLGAVAATSVALVNVGVASDPLTKQVDVVGARDTANALFWVGGIAAVVGAGLTAGGVFLLVAE
jgi:hypothetical protein